MEELRKIVFPYKRNQILRALFIVSVSVALWFIVDGGLEEGFAFPLLVGGMEYMTINMLFEMDFPPVDVYARRTFGDKHTFGYKATYILIYFGIWVMVVIALMDRA